MSPAVWQRGLRVTITACVVFYGCRYGLGDPTMGVYAVFAVIAFALLSQATGTPAQRTRTLLVCLAVGLVVVVIATYAAATIWLAVLTMFVGGFLVAFAAVGGVHVVEVSLGLQLLFILPSSPPYDPGSLWSRLIGLTIGLLALIVADRVLWPTPAPQGFDGRLLDAAERVHVLAEGLLQVCRRRGSVGTEELDRRLEDARAACTGLRLVEVPLAERPSSPSRMDRGLTHAAGALRALFGRLAAVRVELREVPDERPAQVLSAVSEGLADVRDTLRRTGPVPSFDRLAAAVEAERARWRSELLQPASSVLAREAGSVAGAATLVAATQAANGQRTLTLAVRAAFGAPVPDADAGPDAPFWYARHSLPYLVWHRVRRNLTPRSVILQNALRLAVALAAARWAVGQFDLSHGLWVLLATLTLMRTSVRATRGALWPAILGTTIGAVLTAALLLVAGDEQLAYVVGFPIFLVGAVLAGPLVGTWAVQASFTLVVACLFSQVSPPTWQLAKDRLVDVLVGAALGILVGAAAWPRGGRAEMRRAGSRCLAAAADCIDTTADWLIRACAPETLQQRLDEVRQALALFDGTYAQYRSEPVDGDDHVDWLAVGVTTYRAAAGAASARRWSDEQGRLPWPDQRDDLDAAARQVAGEYRAVAERITSGAGDPHAEDTAAGAADQPNGVRSAVRTGLALVAEEPGRAQHPDATLRAVEAWGWLWWLGDDLARLDGTPTRVPAHT